VTTAGTRAPPRRFNLTRSCTTLEADRALAAKAPTHGFEFADPDAPNAQRIPTVDGFPFGAAHGTEMSYLFPFPGV
jgi:para-nitrobenzyl esterase